MNQEYSLPFLHAARNELQADLPVSDVTTADVIIVGSGVAGLSIALGLARSGPQNSNHHQDAFRWRFQRMGAGRHCSCDECQGFS